MLTDSASADPEPDAGASELLEPNRFALIIGVGPKYTELGSLPRLENSCSEAHAVAEALRANYWTDVFELPCDATNDQIYEAIQKFKDKVNLTPRAFALIYYTGHGIQAGNKNYIFGANTDIDAVKLAAEAVATKRIRFDTTDPDTHQYVRNSVDIAEPFAHLESPYSKSVIILLDACRDNPIEEELHRVGIKVSYPTKVQKDAGVSYLFSTQDGTPSRTGVGKELSPFTAELIATLDQIRNSLAISKPVDTNNLIVFGTKVKSNVLRRTGYHQDPDWVNQIIDPPTYCIQGCPSARAEWDQNVAETIILGFGSTGAPPLARATRAHPKLMYVSNPSSKPVDGSVRLIKLNFQTAPASIQPVNKTAPPHTEPNDISLRPMNFDVFWCDGDPRSAARKDEALKIGQGLVERARSPFSLSGYRLGLVRVRSLPAAVNAKPGYRRSDTGIFVDSNNPAEKEWATMVMSDVNTTLRRHITTKQTKEYVSIVVCEGYKASDTLTTVYIQVAVKDQTIAAAQIGDKISETLSGIKVISGIQVVANSPDETVVRYFNAAQATSARQVSTELEGLLLHPVNATLIKGYKGALKGVPVMEVWFGKNDKALNSIVK
ncbi:hypothetical protein MMA231_01238 [Asticcacaulis sp. MM231]